jgi:hypothetical protein
VNDTFSKSELVAEPYDDVADAYNLTILKAPGDWSLENGDLVLTKDGDIKVGDDAYNGLFRFVQSCRYNVFHLRYLYETMKKMAAREEHLEEEINAIGTERGTQLAAGAHDVFGSALTEFAATLHAANEERDVATFGAGLTAAV